MSGRILVVEDDRVSQGVIRMMLTRLGLEPEVVGTGNAALEVLAGTPLSAVLMDCQLPGMDGYETTRRMRERLGGRPLPIIALTANAMGDERIVCEAAGMDDFLTKPVRIEQLRDCLARWLPAKRG